MIRKVSFTGSTAVGKRFVTASGAITVGDGLEPETGMGPMLDPRRERWTLMTTSHRTRRRPNGAKSCLGEKDLETRVISIPRP